MKSISCVSVPNIPFTFILKVFLVCRPIVFYLGFEAFIERRIRAY